MAVTAEEVHRAADALLAAGEKATLRAVRSALGGGSFTSIAPLLRQWDLNRLRQSEPNRLLALPVQAALEQAAPMIWEAAFAAATERVQPQLAAHQAAVAEQLERHQEQLAVLRGLEQDLELERAHAVTAAAELSRLTAEISTLTTAHQKLSETNADLSAQLRVLEERRSTGEHERAALRTALEREREARAEQDRNLDQALSDSTHLRADQDRLKHELRSERAQLATHLAEHKQALADQAQSLGRRDQQLEVLARELGEARQESALRAADQMQTATRLQTLISELSALQSAHDSAQKREHSALAQEREAREAHQHLLRQYAALATTLGERLAAIQQAVVKPPSAPDRPAASGSTPPA